MLQYSLGDYAYNLINFALGIKLLGVDYMNFKPFSRTQIAEYTEKVKGLWGKSKEYKEFEEKSKNRGKEEDMILEKRCMELFMAFSKIKDADPAKEEAQCLVKELQDFFTINFYECTNEILRSLGKMYSSGGDFTKSIDTTCGEGTAEFVDKAIEIYCK